MILIFVVHLFVSNGDSEESLDLRNIDERNESVHLVLRLLVLIAAARKADANTVGHSADSL